MRTTTQKLLTSLTFTMLLSLAFFSITDDGKLSSTNKPPERSEITSDQSEGSVSPPVQQAQQTQPSYVPGEVLVKFKASKNPDNTVLSTALGPSIKGELKRTNKLGIATVKLPTDTDVLETVAKLKKDPNVEFAEPNYILYGYETPNDPEYPKQWAHQKIQSEAAWDITKGSKNVSIAIIDTGVDWTHPDLAANIWNNTDEIPNNGLDDDGNGYVDDVRGWDFVTADASWVYAGEDPGPPDNDPMDVHGHGTHVAGIAGAVGNNSIGVAGVAWNGSIMPLRAGFKDTNGNAAFLTSDVIDAIIYAADNGARIISMSFGSLIPEISIKFSLDYAYSKNVVLVAAAGNYNSDYTISYPAWWDNVIAVAATNETDQKASFSDYNSWIDISAPGVNIYSTLPNNRYGWKNGTSMSTPLVAGVAALVISRNPSFTNKEVRAVLQSTIDELHIDTYIGVGRVNANKALKITSVPVAKIISPQIWDSVQGIVKITGTADGTNFSHYTVEYGNGIYPSSWTMILNSSTPVVDNILAFWNTTTIIDQVYTIKLRASDTLGNQITDRIFVKLQNSGPKVDIKGFEKIWERGWGWIYSIKYNKGGSKIAFVGPNIYVINITTYKIEKRIIYHPTYTQFEPAVRDVEWSPDGKILIAGIEDGIIGVWNASSGKLMKKLFGHGNTHGGFASYGVLTLAWSPDGKRLASGAIDKTIKIWNTTTWSIVANLTGHSMGIWGLSWSPDGGLLASGSSDNTIKIWNTTNWSLIRTLTGHANTVFGIQFSPNGTFLASPSKDKTIKIWDITTGSTIRTLTGHTESVNSVKWFSNGSWIVSGSGDKTIRFWNISTGTAVRVLTNHTDPVFSVALSPDEKQLASGSDGGECAIRFWNVSSGYNVYTLQESYDIHAASVSPNGTLLALGDGKKVSLVNVSTGSIIKSLNGGPDVITDVKWSPDGSLLAASTVKDQGGYANIFIWNTFTWQKIKTLTGQSWICVGSISWSPNGTFLAAGGNDNKIVIWDVNAGSAVKILQGHTDWVISVSWSPNGTLLASSSIDSTVKIWDVLTWKNILTLLGHGDVVRAVSWSPDGKMLASASYDKTFKLWNTSTWVNIKTIKPEDGFGGQALVSAIWSPDGKWLAVGGGALILLYDTYIWTIVKRIYGSYGVPRGVWSPNGTLFAGDLTVLIPLRGEITFRIAHTTPINTETDILGGRQHIKITFNRPANQSAIQNAITITPQPVIYSYKWYAYTLVITADLKPGTKYTVRINSSIAKDTMLLPGSNFDGPVGNYLDGNRNGIEEGSPIDDFVFSFTTKKYEKLELNLRKGWNLISIPFELSNTSVENVFRSVEGNYTLVRWYNSATQRWLSYSPNRAQYLNTLTNIDHGRGVWIFITNPCTLIFEGNNPSTTTIHLNVGWNLVGYPSETLRTVDEIKLARPEIDIIQAFNASAPYFLKTLGGNDKLSMGNGYWVHAIKTCDWIISW